MRFQSTPPVKAATKRKPKTHDPSTISIHAAREGGDAEGLNLSTSREISIHAAREGGDSVLLMGGYRLNRFQSTPPVKAATMRHKYTPAQLGFQSTPPVKAATYYDYAFATDHPISIHAAREGGDSTAPGFSAS